VLLYPLLSFLTGWSDDLGYQDVAALYNTVTATVVVFWKREGVEACLAGNLTRVVVLVIFPLPHPLATTD